MEDLKDESEPYRWGAGDWVCVSVWRRCFLRTARADAAGEKTRSRLAGPCEACYNHLTARTHPPLLPRRMVMETIDKVVAALGAADIDARLEEQLVDGILYAFQEQARGAAGAGVAFDLGGRLRMAHALLLLPAHGLLALL